MELTDKDIGRWVCYVDFDLSEEKGKIKSYNNKTQTAFVVFNANGNWDLDHRKDYTAQRCNYSDLKLC